jgi:hypothetical protein
VSIGSVIVAIIIAVIAAASCEAQAAPIGSIPGTKGASFTLFDSLGICVAPAKHANWATVDRSTVVAGCWKQAPDPDAITIVFLDGDAVLIPKSAIKPIEGL